MLIIYVEEIELVMKNGSKTSKLEQTVIVQFCEKKIFIFVKMLIIGKLTIKKIFSYLYKQSKPLKTSKPSVIL